MAISGALASSAALSLAVPGVASAGSVSFTTSLVKDVNTVAFGDHPEHLTVVGNDVFFEAYTPSAGFELWKSDGTAAGTMMVKDINPGPSSSYPSNLTNVNGTLFFEANDGTTGYVPR